MAILEEDIDDAMKSMRWGSGQVGPEYMAGLSDAISVVRSMEGLDQEDAQHVIEMLGAIHDIIQGNLECQDGVG